MNKDNIKAIVFDFGAVLININYNLTLDAFKKLGIPKFELFFSKAQQSNLFNLLETGLISEIEFCNSIKNYLPNGISNKQIIDAWNAMLLDLPKENIDFVYKLKLKYKTYLLSNTNAIHANKFFIDMEKNLSKEYFYDAFTGVYLSHEIGLRKPDNGIFNYVQASAKCNNNEILFIDDSIQHIKGALAAGWQTIHLQQNEKVINVLNFLV